MLRIRRRVRTRDTHGVQHTGKRLTTRGEREKKRVGFTSWLMPMDACEAAAVAPEYDTKYIFELEGGPRKTSDRAGVL